MKKYSCLLITIFFLSTKAYAFQPKIEIIEQFDDLKMVAFISPDDIKSDAEWNPNLEAPPLTVDGAIQAVKAFVKLSGEIKKIELKQLPKYENHWHYLIMADNDSMKSKYSIYVVLMSGAVIPAIIEPQGYK